MDATYAEGAQYNPFLYAKARWLRHREGAALVFPRLMLGAIGMGKTRFRLA